MGGIIRNMVVLAAAVFGGGVFMMRAQTAGCCDSLALACRVQACGDMRGAEEIQPSVINRELPAVQFSDAALRNLPALPVLKPVFGPMLYDKSVRFDARQLIAPVTLVALSTFGVWNTQAKSVNRSVRAAAGRLRGDNYIHADDYIQYLPAVSYLGLGAVGVKARHNFKERLIILATSYIAMGIMVNSLKYTVREIRPDNSRRNSYPSGHTATAFMGAELVRGEYGLGCGIAAYVVAGGVGVLRIYNNRHWLNDVLAGAGIGILSARIGFWMLPVNRRLFGMERVSKGCAVAPSLFFDGETSAVGGGVAVRFM